MELLTAKLHAKANAEVVIVNIRLIYTYTYIFLPELYIVYICQLSKRVDLDHFNKELQVKGC